MAKTGTATPDVMSGVAPKYGLDVEQGQDRGDGGGKWPMPFKLRTGVKSPTVGRFIQRRARVPAGGDSCGVQVESRALPSPSRIRSSPNANSSP